MICEEVSQSKHHTNRKVIHLAIGDFRSKYQILVGLLQVRTTTKI